jgi:hypothetical protein
MRLLVLIIIAFALPKEDLDALVAYTATLKKKK